MSPTYEENHTQPPPGGTPVVLYDGLCMFCTDQATRLHRAARGRFLLRSFQDAGVLDDYPGLTHDACMKEIKMIAGDGRIFGGAEAIVRAIMRGHPLTGWVFSIYYVPGARWMADRVYANVARNRYSLRGRHADQCDSGACQRHGHD
jgi:predicted DCC family thiol-disulfide oxidoreductase YuxK